MKPGIVAAVATAALLLVSCAVTKVVVPTHPGGTVGVSRCPNCHTGRLAAYEHGPGFAQGHGISASGQATVCDSCHRPSFCADCHGRREEVRPSDLYPDQPSRDLPHRGNYLARHRIDGRIDPASCRPCHGRRDDTRCRACHR